MKPYETITVSEKEYHMRFTMSSAVKFEDKMNLSFVDGISKLDKLSVMAEYFLAAIDELKSIEEVYRLFDMAFFEGKTIKDLQDLLLDCFVTSGFLPESWREQTKKMEAAQQKMIADTLSRQS